MPALFDHTDAVVADDHCEGFEGGGADGLGVGGLEVQTLKEEREEGGEFGHDEGGRNGGENAGEGG